MYCPEHFQEDSPAAFASLIEQFPLATIFWNGPSGLIAYHVPLIFEASTISPGKLVGHVAKINPLWQCQADQELLVVFQGPSTYISPNWYATKHEAGKVVPTWNYAVVHAHCTLQAIHDPAQILQILTKLTDRHEAFQAEPWSVADAPSDFIERLVNNIVGIELTINRLQGKWKVSQNQPAANRHSVAQGLLAAGSDAQTKMARLVQAYGSN